MSEQVKGFLNNLLAGAVWDGIKQLWAPLVLAGIVAAWQKLKHGSLDWFAILGIFVVASILGFFNFRKGKKSGISAIEVPPPEPKLKIHRALYGIGPQADIDITRSLQSRPREGLVIPVDNHLVDHDPAINARKRLELRYSYGDGAEHYVYRLESKPGEMARLVLPEDTEVQRLAAELSHLQGQHSTELTNALNDKAKAENRVLQVEADKDSLLNRLTALIHELLTFIRDQGPVPELKPEELGTEQGKKFAAEIEKRIHRVHSGFSLRLHPAIEKITLELGEIGIFDYSLAQLMHNPAHSESDISAIAQKLITLRDRLEVQEYGGEPHNLTYSRISTTEIRELLGAKGPAIQQGIDSKG